LREKRGPSQRKEEKKSREYSGGRKKERTRFCPYAKEREATIPEVSIETRKKK